MLPQILVREPLRLEAIQDQDAEEGLHPGRAEGQGGDTVAVDDLGAGHLRERVFADEAVVAALSLLMIYTDGTSCSS